jgi:hypothetical protein
MAITKDSRPKKVADIYKTLDVMIMMADDVEELTLLSVALLMRARLIMKENHGSQKTIAMLTQLADELREENSLPKLA